MGRTARSRQNGEQRLRFTTVTGSSTRATIGNSGVTLITTATGTDYVLYPPEEGVIKTILMNQATTGVFVRACPAGTTTVTFTSTAADNVIEFDAAGQKAITLVGLNSTSWQVLYRNPATTAINVGTS